MQTTALIERLDLLEAHLDHENYTIRQRVIKAGWSLNGRYYSESALQKATSLLEGVRTFHNHPSRSEQKDRPERSVRDITGYLKDPEYKDGAIYATRHVIGEAREWLWPLIVEVAKGNAPNLMGCSINAIGTGKTGEFEGKKGLIVEAITDFNSVDDVVSPAAFGSFVPLVASVGDDFTQSLLQALTYEEFCEARTDYVQRLKKEWQTVRLADETKAKLAEADTQVKAAKEETRIAQESVTEKDAQLETLTAQRDAALLEAGKARRELAVEKTLAKTKFNEEWKSELRGSLMEAEPDTWLQIIESKRALLRAIPVKPSVKNAAIQESKPITATESQSLLPLDGENVDAWDKRRARIKGNK